ncbi:hypothetical protein [Rhodococcus sp. SGAir0479]|uniref:hypothetical protein n=1 Tax=Rhodococcus sp. SGAir0479 TaxID=2567884 RepID=UPI0010CCB9D1|nr:hypothetical protein [Rhodococcus sp. SGAir0479]QCQ91727.1 hypothetical protein E7742_11120 [Rhodococcus sp. SGAir0479]
MSSYGEVDTGDFDNAEIDALKAQELPNNEVPPGAAEHLLQAQVDRARQDNDHRDQLLTWTMWIVPFALMLNFGIFVLYMGSEWGHISDGVMIAWISATVVEVLGIAYIIASDLFKDGTGGR